MAVESGFHEEHFELTRAERREIRSEMSELDVIDEGDGAG